MGVNQGKAERANFMNAQTVPQEENLSKLATRKKFDELDGLLRRELCGVGFFFKILIGASYEKNTTGKTVLMAGDRVINFQ